MGRIVPYIRTEAVNGNTVTITEDEREYLGQRIGKSPKISQMLLLGKLVNDPRELAQKLDADAPDTGGDSDYEASVIDD